ncbi:MAG TPA: hypothetical protein VGM82_08560 [Gemmatimonadaceae bacterium]|jgi:hypothetical protein
MSARTVLLARSAVVMLAATACAGSAPGASRTEVSTAPRFEGTIAVATTIDPKACGDARVCAEEQAVRSVLFMGVPGSSMPKAMVPNESEAKQAHAAFFTDLLEKKGFQKYIVRVDDSAVTSTEHPEEKRWNVVINSDALRRALESAGVIRKFGY